MDMPGERFDEAIRILVEQGKKEGYLTYDDINNLLPNESVSPEKIDNLLMMLDEYGVNLVDEKEIKSESEDIGSEDSDHDGACLLYTSPSPRDLSTSRMPSSA